MLGLVNYDSSSDSKKSDSSDSSDSEAEETLKTTTKPAQILPSALDLLQTSKQTTAVLGNPYREAEDAKIAALEKHVKMVENDEKIILKNGKKICWNFRKGRCRFGSKCTYAHDSDIQGMSSTPAEPSTSIEIIETDKKPPPPREKKKRPGLSDGLVPSKKVLKNYSSQK
ncbi:hypothetical protein ACFFRR_007925 [Megaselia abdita]